MFWYCCAGSPSVVQSVECSNQRSLSRTVPLPQHRRAEGAKWKWQWQRHCNSGPAATTWLVQADIYSSSYQIEFDVKDNPYYMYLWIIIESTGILKCSDKFGDQSSCIHRKALKCKTLAACSVICNCASCSSLNMVCHVQYFLNPCCALVVNIAKAQMLGAVKHRCSTHWKYCTRIYMYVGCSQKAHSQMAKSMQSLRWYIAVRKSQQKSKV